MRSKAIKVTGDLYDRAAMRAQAPVMWHPMPRNGVGFWALTGFEDVKRVNGDPETFSSEKGGILMALGAPETRHPVLFSASTNSMINLDARPHRELRREHMPYFTATYMKGLRTRVAALITHLEARLAQRGLADGLVPGHAPHFCAWVPPPARLEDVTAAVRDAG